jgi:hypothetical protein
MLENLETSFAATLAEQHLVHLRATKLGPLLAEVERRPAVPTPAAGPRLTVLVARVVHRLGAVRRRRVRSAPELRPLGGR